MPEFTQRVMVLPKIAENAITKNRCVKFGTSDDQCDVAGANEEIIGVALNNADPGELVDVLVFGFTDVEASGAITRGALVAAAANGKIQAITPGTTTADLRVLGRAWQAAAADTDHISVFVNTSNIFVVV